MTGHVIVPGSCIHWKRRKKLLDRQLVVSRHTFYQMALDELTKREKGKYLELVAQANEDEEAASEAS